MTKTKNNGNQSDGCALKRHGHLLYRWHEKELDFFVDKH